MRNKYITKGHEAFCKQNEEVRKRGKVFGGILIVIAGSLFLAKELGAQIPHWVFSWKMFLIALGLLIGVKHKFLHTGWIILILIGGVFLLPDIFPDNSIKPILWPVAIILFGLYTIFKSGSNYNKWKNVQYEAKDNCCIKEEIINDDFIESTLFMGGIKKNVLSKKFKGGDITNVFGGAEINLIQADFENTATLEMTNIFAGTRLIIPAHWEINSDIVAVFGSIEDKRPTMQTDINNEAPKVLVLKGTTFFGGIDIKSY